MHLDLHLLNQLVVLFSFLHVFRLHHFILPHACIGHFLGGLFILFLFSLGLVDCIFQLLLLIFKLLAYSLQLLLHGLLFLFRFFSLSLNDLFHFAELVFQAFLWRFYLLLKFFYCFFEPSFLCLLLHAKMVKLFLRCFQGFF